MLGRLLLKATAHHQDHHGHDHDHYVDHHHHHHYHHHHDQHLEGQGCCYLEGDEEAPGAARGLGVVRGHLDPVRLGPRHQV